MQFKLRCLIVFFSCLLAFTVLLVPVSAAATSDQEILSFTFQSSDYNPDLSSLTGEVIYSLDLTGSDLSALALLVESGGYFYAPSLGVSGALSREENALGIILYRYNISSSLEVLDYPCFLVALFDRNTVSLLLSGGSLSNVPLDFPFTVQFSSEPFVEQSGTGSLMGDLGSVGSSFLGVVGDIADTIVSTPLLLFTVGIFFMGGCVAMFGRFLSKD